jgi:hypothetical protein
VQLGVARSLGDVVDGAWRREDAAVEAMALGEDATASLTKFSEDELQGSW